MPPQTTQAHGQKDSPIDMLLDAPDSLKGSVQDYGMNTIAVLLGLDRI